MDDNEFKQLIENNYEGAGINELWNSYVIMENNREDKRDKENKSFDGAKEIKLEVEVLIGLMRKIPYEKKKDFYDKMLNDYIDFNGKGVSIDNLVEFCETLESLDFFKNEIFNKNE